MEKEIIYNLSGESELEAAKRFLREHKDLNVEYKLKRLLLRLNEYEFLLKKGYTFAPTKERENTMFDESYDSQYDSQGNSNTGGFQNTIVSEEEELIR